MLGLSAILALPVTAAGVALLLLSIALLVLEAKLGTRGILGAGGALAMILGAVLLIEGPPEMRIRLGTAVAATLPFAVITVVLLATALRARANKAAYL
jgi:membrane-bound serine protease (ClpP class)